MEMEKRCCKTTSKITGFIVVVVVGDSRELLSIQWKSSEATKEEEEEDLFLQDLPREFPPSCSTTHNVQWVTVRHKGNLIAILCCLLCC